MKASNLLVNLKICVILSIYVSFVVSNNSEESDENHNWFLSSEEDNEIENGTSTKKVTPPPKPKRWNREGLCDHDAVTSIILKMILDAQQRMSKGDNTTGLLPLDPLHIPEFVMNQAEFVAENNSSTGPQVQANIEDIYLADWSNFNVTGITADMDKMLINISIALESIAISGAGRLKMGPLRFPIFGNGKFLFKPQGVSTFIYAIFGSHENGTRYLKDFDFGLALQKLIVEITGPLRPVRKWNPLEGVLSRVGGSLFNRLENRIHPELRRRGIQEISIRIATFKMLTDEILEEMLNHSVYCYFG